MNHRLLNYVKFRKINLTLQILKDNDAFEQTDGQKPFSRNTVASIKK